MKNIILVCAAGLSTSLLVTKMKSAYEPKGIKVAVIDMADYGMMNGKKVLQSAYAMMGE